MGVDGLDESYWIPEHVRACLRGLGYRLPLEDMEGHIRLWDDWMASRGDFYDYTDSDSFGRVYKVHRRSIRPAMRVCREWGSLLLNEKTVVVADKQKATDWLSRYFAETGFMAMAQDTLVRAFGLGTGAFAIWLDTRRRGRDAVRIRHYDARMVVPLTWDAEGVTECAFVTRAFYKGEAIDQLQIHRQSGGGTFAIHTICFDSRGNRVAPEGVVEEVDTGSASPTFAIVRPAIQNTRVDMSPYGQSVFADALDALASVDLAFDALVSEVDLSKMRIFLSDVMFDRDAGDKGRPPIPFGKNDCTIFRKVMSTDELVKEFAPALRTDAQSEVFRVALQMLGDLCGFGLTYFDFDSSGYIRTATEVCSDNSALMRNIRRHENLLSKGLATISRSLIACARQHGERVPEPKELSVAYDDSIIQDTQSEKAQDMLEVGVTMQPWEYRMKWYGEDEVTARSRVEGLGNKAGQTVQPGVVGHA